MRLNLRRNRVIDRKELFCRKHSRQLKHLIFIRSSKPKQGWWRSDQMNRLLTQARREIGYSPRTVDLDILHSLFRCYQKQHQYD